MKCEHKNRENLSSWYITGNNNSITVKCKDCGMIRYESRNKKDGSGLVKIQIMVLKKEKSDDKLSIHTKFN